MTSSPLTVTIDRLSYGPAGIVRVDGKVVFVPDTVPGDEVVIEIEEEKKSYATGRVVEVRTPSPHRRQPPCPYVQQCGGCPWQHIEYAKQVCEKETLVREQLRRIGGITDIPVLPILPSPQEWQYRHRIRLHVDEHRRLGFSAPRSHKVVTIDSCAIAWRGVEAHLQAARVWLAELRTPLRQVEITVDEREENSAQPRAVFFAEACGSFQAADAAFCVRFLETHAQVSGMLLQGKDWRRTWGETALVLTTGDASLTIQDGAFTQVNTAANYLLVKSVIALSEVRSDDRVIELYCGAGNLSLPLARQAREVIGVEQDERALRSARANAASNGVANVRFLHASARTGVRELLKHGVKSEVIVLDPPRTGAADIIDDVPRLGARTIVYVSCDPATLARDLRRLHQHGYAPRVAQPVDMFPQTYHVETIAVSVLTC